MSTENEGLYTSIDTGKTGDEKQQNDNSDNPNNDMETLPVGEGVHTVDEADHHHDMQHWNDGNLPRETEGEEHQHDGQAADGDE